MLHRNTVHRSGIGALAALFYNTLVRYYVIGDIHGCYEQLRELEERVRRLHGDVHFVSVGDLVDRGPQSKEVLAHILEGIKRGTHSAVLGNHDDMFLTTVALLRPDMLASYTPLFSASARDMYLHWLSLGGDTTLASFGCAASRPDLWQISADMLSDFAALPLVWESEDLVVTHATTTRTSLETIRIADRVPQHLREELLWNREVPHERPHEKKIHISGHTVMSRITKYEKLGMARIDTGCVYGGTLSAYDALADTAVSVSR